MNLAAFQESPCGEFRTRITDRPIPGPDEIVIEVAAIALNQIDKRVAKHAAFPLPYPAILGACIAGRVQALGSAPAHSTTESALTLSRPLRFAVGDHVAAYTSFYSRKDRKDNRFGAFQQHVLCNERTVLKLNSSIALSDAATIVASAPLAGVALSQHVGITLSVEQKTINGGNDDDDDDEDDDASVLLSSLAKDEKKLKLLCNGASTGIGGFIIQLAAQSGHQVICTVKSANNEYVRNLGAHKVFDYTDTTRIVDQLAEEGPYDAIIDCISTERTIQLLNSAVAQSHVEKSITGALPTIFTLLPVPSVKPSPQGGGSGNERSSSGSSMAANDDAQRCPTRFMWLTASFGMDEEDKRDFTRSLFWDVLQSKLDAGKLTATPPLIVRGKLTTLGKALSEALERMGDVSAQKVVVMLDD